VFELTDAGDGFDSGGDGVTVGGQESSGSRAGKIVVIGRDLAEREWQESLETALRTRE